MSWFIVNQKTKTLSLNKEFCQALNQNTQLEAKSLVKQYNECVLKTKRLTLDKKRDFQEVKSEILETLEIYKIVMCKVAAFSQQFLSEDDPRKGIYLVTTPDGRLDLHRIKKA